jgi:hypothetical protein
MLSSGFRCYWSALFQFQMLLVCSLPVPDCPSLLSSGFSLY